MQYSPVETVVGSLKMPFFRLAQQNFLNSDESSHNIIQEPAQALEARVFEVYSEQTV
jgi:hypothetical protein